MATMTPHITERRHLADRRTDRMARTDSRMGVLDWLAMVLTIIGGLNWGLVGLFGIDLVASFFGEMTTPSRIVYLAVGLAALYSLYTASKMSRQH